MTVRKVKAVRTQKEVSAPQSRVRPWWPEADLRFHIFFVFVFHKIQRMPFYLINLFILVFILRYFRNHRSSSSTEM